MDNYWYAKDIIEKVSVPYFWFSDLLLGNTAKTPNNIKSQKNIIYFVLELFKATEWPITDCLPLA
jgi:hypothetical protein